MDTALKTTVSVPLTVPVTVPAADGKAAERSSLTLRRPKTRHVKRLAALIGAEVLDILLSDDTARTAKVEGRELVGNVLRTLFDEDRLDGLTALIADLCDEDQAVIDDVDLVDLPALLMAFGGFFPKLQSAASGMLQAISQSAAATTPAP
ncbi:hypothetical protein [Shinella sp.]|uniref:hypothetical protein n=1 Tax=Shinella sp. TaxID=1870904 RepID=UPI003F70D41A